MRQAVTLRIYDVTGREVATLLNGLREAGLHHIHWQSGHAPSGIYYVQLTGAGRTDTLKLVKIE